MVDSFLKLTRQTCGAHHTCQVEPVDAYYGGGGEEKRNGNPYGFPLRGVAFRLVAVVSPVVSFDRLGLTSDHLVRQPNLTRQRPP